MSNNSDFPRVIVRASDAPLTDLEAITTVQLLQSVPAYVREPIARVARQALEAAPKLKAIATVWLAVWPDGTCAMLIHNPDWPRPRPEQLVRAYRTARALCIAVPSTSASRRSTMLEGV